MDYHKQCLSLIHIFPSHTGFCFKADYDLKNNLFYFMETNGQAIWAYRYAGAGQSTESIKGGQNRTTISVNPNPFKSHVVLTLPDKFTKAKIFNAAGACVATVSSAGKESNKIIWNGEKFQSGAYMIVAERDGTRIAKKIVLMR